MSGWERVVGTTSLDDENAKTAVADCTPGKKVVGGGYLLSGRSGTALTRSLVDGSHPLDDDTWQVTTRSTVGGGDNSYAVTVYAICTTALP